MPTGLVWARVSDPGGGGAAPSPHNMASALLWGGAAPLALHYLPAWITPLAAEGTSARLGRYIFSRVNDARGDLPPQRDRVRRFVLAQAAQDRHLRAQHVAFGDTASAAL